MPAQVAILTGTTASGKTALALDWARKHGGLELVNADSLLVYRGFDVGTAKPTAEEQAQVAHHLIDIREPNEVYTAGDFRRDALAAIDAIAARGRRALIVGGTGFYLKALLHGLWEGPPADPALRARLSALPAPELYSRLEARDSEAALRIGVNDPYRLVRALELIELTGESPTELEAKKSAEPDPRFTLWITDRKQEELGARIEARTKAMLEAGLLEEARRLREKFPESRALSAVGYAECLSHLDGRAPAGRRVRAGAEGLADEISLATRQLVKKQRTWFKGQHPYAQWFTLERDRAALDAQFAAVYGGA